MVGRQEHGALIDQLRDNNILQKLALLGRRRHEGRVPRIHFDEAHAIQQRIENGQGHEPLIRQRGALRGAVVQFIEGIAVELGAPLAALDVFLPDAMRRELLHATQGGAKLVAQFFNTLARHRGKQPRRIVPGL
jgi:hypothetical protein